MSQVYTISLGAQSGKAGADPNPAVVPKGDVVVFIAISPNTYFQVDINNSNLVFKDSRTRIMEIVSDSQPLTLVTNEQNPLSNGSGTAIYDLSLWTNGAKITRVQNRIVLRP